MALIQKSKSKNEYRVLTGLLFGEGKKDSKFINNLINLKKFKDHTSPPWTFLTDHSSGGSPGTVLEKCKRYISGRGFDLIICFIDLDVLKRDYAKSWKQEVTKLEEKYTEIKIFWQEENLEDEIIKVLGDKRQGKSKINTVANKDIQKFINSNYWKRLLSIIKNKEGEV
jgi:hypothetical protein